MSNGKFGRPCKLTPEVHDEVVEIIKGGNYIETACAMVGIGRSTYYGWLKKAKESSRTNRYTKFQDAVEKAQAWAEARDVAIISRHAEKVWQAAAWLLERKYPNRWGRKRQKKLEKKVVEKAVVTPVNMSKEQLPPEDRELKEYDKYFKYLEPEDLEDKDIEEDIQNKRPISTAEIEFFVKRQFHPLNPEKNSP